METAAPKGHPQLTRRGTIFHSGSGDVVTSAGGVQNITLNQNIHNGDVLLQDKDDNRNLADLCFRSLTFPESDTRFKDIDAASSGTCQWFVQHDTYKTWKSSDGGLLWVKGNPGSGKSTLLRHVLDSLLSQTEPGGTDNSLILSFFFHGRGAELQRSPAGLYRSLLCQLWRAHQGVRADIVKAFETEYNRNGKSIDTWQWHERDVRAILRSALQKALETHAIWLFIDALDEAGKDNAMSLREQFMSILQGLPPTGHKSLHLCITCRHYPNLPTTQEELFISMDDENSDDISTFVHKHLLSAFTPDEEVAIRELITEGSRGVFLWASLATKTALDLKEDGAVLSHILTSINNVPGQLEDVYTQYIKELAKEPESLRLVQIACCAIRPMTLDEWQWAMLVRSDCEQKTLDECFDSSTYAFGHEEATKRIRKTSCGLIEVTSDTQVVQFIHESTKQFFIDHGLPLLAAAQRPDLKDMRAAKLEARSHYELYLSCVKYFEMADDEVGGIYGKVVYEDRDDRDRIRKTLGLKFPLMSYCLDSWDTHAYWSELESDLAEDQDFVASFFIPDESFVDSSSSASYAMDPDEYDKMPSMTMLHIAARDNMMIPLTKIIQREASQGSKGGPSGIPSKNKLLDKASNALGRWSKSRKPAVTPKVDLDDYYDDAINKPDHYNRTPLSWAARNGNYDAALLLLDNGALLNVADEWEISPSELAAREGHARVLELLLNRGADFDSTTTNKMMNDAAMGGSKDVVQLLMDRGAEPDKTVLASAAAGDQMDMVQFLLSKHFTIRHEALAAAALSGADEIIKLFMSRGADIHALDPDKRNLVFFAAEGGHESTAELVAKDDAAYDAVDVEGWTPLHFAATHGHLSMVKMILDKGVRVDTKDKGGKTPLYSAGWEGHDDIAKLLLARGARIDAISPEIGCTLVHSAADAGSVEMVSLYIENGAEVDPPTFDDGMTPLHVACSSGRVSVVKLLLDLGAQINRFTKDTGMTPLHIAAEKGNDEVAELLLERGADIDTKSKPKGHTPLVIAIQEDHHSTVELLAEKGARTMGPGWASSGHQALLVAAPRYGGTEMVRSLLKHGAKPECQDRPAGYLSPLYLACRSCKVESARLLLDHGAEINCSDGDPKKGYTPLYFAAFWGSGDLAKLLIERGADMEQKDKRLRATPLFHAAERGHAEVVRVLIEHGADVNHKGPMGVTAMAAALASEASSNKEAGRLIKEAGGDMGFFSLMNRKGQCEQQ